ncbi:MAG: putative 2-aminoethylphosphonate ABC transporter ATP-binding protein [Rhodospirillaceae bacterium]|jgi:iron(III) transport system ATP-binding protein|nr:putative 2-aminoethylphosphonate ABC transporter ATP-binding protein [Rhodospirillaceae bacterium]MBT5300305.1 putative 2-aminoethylphosphonate ABC transporter ATP-binding protein [Rhodospirillaceae bacterium]MBT5513115.1 putative 2-aminoethylphosphonate ABC transporter ATP-binding protein [Rhodospirillaceae bacterium]MBT6087441.1 putative 2-aminoethylphosphonate ABC transporter ATP-binding protein [Rhodospirillaceae bacterium]MBT6883639.1 putative 2-aminoethylphosphonate ABC transporter ATP
MDTGNASVENGYLVLSGVTKDFGTFRALSDISFDIGEGEFICFLGPSGCGKTTLLRCVAGLETQTEGSIHMSGEDISWLPPSRRDFGIVFQSYALFPNLNVTDNVAYGLVNKKMASADMAARVTELLGLVGLASHADKYPGQLSGGEQQRVALVRALATSPGLLLLDEPLSALDAKVRAHLRREIRGIQDRLGVTTIMVTHDQEEAQTMADRIFVMNGGRIEQIGSPGEIYDEPATPFVADFIGVMNFLPVTVGDSTTVNCGDLQLQCDAGGFAAGANISCAVRPEDVLLDDVGDGTRDGTGDGTGNLIETTISDIEYLGSFVRLYLKNPILGDAEIRADVRKDLARDRGVAVNQALRIRIPAESIRLYQTGD